MDVLVMGAGLGGGWLVLQLSRWLARRSPDTLIDTLIHKPVPKYTTNDDALRVATGQRRERADAIKRGARQIETKDDRGYRLRKVM